MVLKGYRNTDGFVLFFFSCAAVHVLLPNLFSKFYLSHYH